MSRAIAGSGEALLNAGIHQSIYKAPLPLPAQQRVRIDCWISPRVRLKSPSGHILLLRRGAGHTSAVNCLWNVSPDTHLHRSRHQLQFTCGLTSTQLPDLESKGGTYRHTDLTPDTAFERGLINYWVSFVGSSDTSKTKFPDSLSRRIHQLGGE